jgi:putative endonuclease
LRCLTRRGYRLVERNYRTRRGEIDLIVRDEDTLVLVEMKPRRTTDFGDPLEAVTLRKQATLRRLAEQYLYHDKPNFDTACSDEVGILARRDGLRVRHVEDAF